MADIREPNFIGIAKLEEKIAELELSLVRSKRRKLELKWELKKAEENEVLTRNAITDLKTQIANVPEEK